MLLIQIFNVDFMSGHRF